MPARLAWKWLIGFWNLISFIDSLIQRIWRIFDFTRPTNFADFCDSMGERLATKALNTDHPLHHSYNFQTSRLSTHVGRSHRRVKVLVSHFGNSFIKYVWCWICVNFNFFLFPHTIYIILYIHLYLLLHIYHTHNTFGSLVFEVKM